MSALPVTRAPAHVDIGSWSPTLVSRAQSLKVQARRRGAGVHRWKLHFSYATMEQSDFWALSAFIDALRGQYTTFTAILPGSVTPYGALGGTPLVVGALAAGVSSAPIDGCSLNITGWGKSGDFFKFGGHSKVYRLTADANTNGSGAVTLSFMPALAATVADNEAVTFSSVPFTLRMASDEEAVLGLEAPLQGVLEFSAIEDY